MLKNPHWTMEIVWYFFLGGVAGGAYFTAAIADNFGSKRDSVVARTGYLLSLPLVMICGLLLIADLGKPSRFLNMLGYFRFWNPMSLGAWAVGVFGLFAFVSSVLSFQSSEDKIALRRKIGLVGTLFGFFLASYTGVLLGATAQPLWTDARLLGALFLASGASTGMAAVTLLVFLAGGSAGEAWDKLQRADRLAIVFELIVLSLFVLMLSSARQALTIGSAAPLFWGGLVVVGLLIPLALDILGHGARLVGALAAVLVLIGGFILRYVMVISVQS